MALGLGKERSLEASVFVNITRGALAHVRPRALLFLVSLLLLLYLCFLATALQSASVQAVPAGAGAVV